MILFRKTQVHWVNPVDTVKVVKEMMYEWTGISLRYQKLFFAGIPLEDHRKLSEYKLYDDCTINVVRIRGGGDTVANSGIRSRGYMSDLELDHFGYLLDKIVRTVRDAGPPHQEVLSFFINVL